MCYCLILLGDKGQPLPDEGGVWIDTKDKETKPDSKEPIHETDTPGRMTVHPLNTCIIF